MRQSSAWAMFVAMSSVMLLLVACGGTPQSTQEVITQAPTLQPQPTRTTDMVFATPLVSALTSVPTNTFFSQPTAVLPPTAIGSFIGNSGSGSVGSLPLLQNGRGITTGSPKNNGEFEVEGYCGILNPEYGVAEDGSDWYCTFNGQRALVLQNNHFDDICRRTYNTNNALAMQQPGSQPAAYRWRCFQSNQSSVPTHNNGAPLLQNGRGITTGRVMNNGEVEVEGFCRAINPAYGVAEDGTFWYCTNNGQPVLTLGTAEFDDICFRTYNFPGAFAEQTPGTQPAAYRWRCYGYP